MSNNLDAKEVTQNTNSNYVQHNTGLAQAIAAITDQTSITVTTANVDLTTGDAQTTTSNKYKALRSAYLKFTGTMDANHNVIVPVNKKLYIVEHACAGGFTVTVKTAGGTGVDIVNGNIALVRCDGTNIVLVGLFSSGSVISDTDDLSEGSTNKYFTDERAQDAIGAMIADTATIDLTYTDGTPELKADVKAASITEAMQTLADNTTGNVSSTKHGYAPKSPADATQFLNGAATPDFAAVKDSDLSTSDITTNDVSTSKHGFAPKLPNDATKYLDGTGAYTVPAGGGGSGTLGGASVQRAAAQTLTAGSTITISFDTEDYDSGSYYSAGSPTRLTVPATGVYLVTARGVQSTEQGTCETTIQLNGTTIVASSGNTYRAINLLAILSLATNDYLELLMFSNGGNTTQTGAGRTPAMQIERLR